MRLTIEKRESKCVAVQQCVQHTISSHLSFTKIGGDAPIRNLS